MTWVAVAIAGGAVVGAVGSNLAANKQAKGQQKAAGTQLGMFNTINAQEQPFIQSGYGATNALNYLMGFGGPGSGFGTQTVSGGSPVTYSPQDNTKKNLGLLFGGGGGLGSVIGLSGLMGGSSHGDEKRNLSAFLNENQVTDLGNGMYQMADGTQFPSDRLKDVAGTWYGATYAPDGGQSDWQQRYSDLMGGFSKAPQTASLAGPDGGASVGGLPAGYLTQTFNPTQEQLEQYPGYQFARDQGLSALRSSLGPSVGALSGPALKSLMAFGTGVANTYYGDYFNQFQTQQNNIFNRLSSIAQLGQNAATQVGNAGTSLGTGVAQAQAAAAGSQAGGIVGATNSLSGSGIPLAMLLAGNNNGTAGATGGTYGDLVSGLSGNNDYAQLIGGG